MIDFGQPSLYLEPQMHIIKPPRLKKGDVIGVIAPASPPRTHRQLEMGIRYLEQLGYRVALGNHVWRQNGYLAGTDKQRAGDLNAMFADRRVKAIFTVRGGYGSHRILPLLDFASIRKNPKIFVGYSDVTALLLAIHARTNIVTFLGPMVASNFSTSGGGEAEEQFWRSLTSTTSLGIVPNPRRARMSPLHTGTATGRLLGGNLSMITSLLATPYLPSFKKSILALEDIDEPPYRIDRMLQHLRLAGVFGAVAGICLGEFVNCAPRNRKTPSLTLSQVFDTVFSSIKRPVLAGIHFGHVDYPLTLPIGLKVRISASRRQLEFLEPAVC